MLVAGVDIGNSTTEILLAEVDQQGVRPVLARRCRTIGQKGSRESLETAARLLDRAERAVERRCAEVAVAKLLPALTLAAEIPIAIEKGVPLEDLSRTGVTTPSGSGFACGTSVSISALTEAPQEAALVVSVPSGVDFEQAAATLAEGHVRGLRIVGVVAADDDAVLIGNRLPFSVPIVDEADVHRLRSGEIVAIEVSAAGQTLRTLSDPVALAGVFGLASEALDALLPLTRRLADARCAVLVSRPTAPDVGGGQDEAWIEYEDASGRVRLALSTSPQQLSRAIRPGTVYGIELPPDVAQIPGIENTVRDFFAVDMPAIDRIFSPRAGSIDLTRVPFSVLTAPRDPAEKTCSLLAQATGRPVREVLGEPDAAALGSFSTPGSSLDAAVCDVGGGTIDLVWADSRVTAAGAGELLTLATAQALGIPQRLAEYVKRSAAFRAEAPHVVRYEDGTKAFVKDALPPEVLGRLCIGVGLSARAFSDGLAPEEWRTLRLAIKRSVIGANVSRCLETLSETPKTLILCGGVALDGESVRIVTEAVGDLGVTVGRANVAGQLGPRYAVAYGLAQAVIAAGPS